MPAAYFMEVIARAIVGDAGVSKFYELVEAADVFKYAFADVRV